MPALDALSRSRHRVVSVFTQPDRPAGRGQAMQPSAVKRRAAELGIPVHQPASFKAQSAAATLSELELDALVVVAYGLILPAAVLAIPRLGCFNIHASLLPRWRGAAPIQRAILAGDTETGVTIMRMEPGLDTGPVLAMRPVPIGELDTAGTLHDRLARTGAELIVETLDALASGSVRERLQPATGITYAEKISKAEALIDWRAPAAHILRQVRAFNPWPIAETRLAGAQLRIWEAELAPAEPDAARSRAAHGRAAPSTEPRPADSIAAPGSVLGASSEGIDVLCGCGALRLLRVQLAGRKPLTAGEFIKAQQLGGARFGLP